MTSRLGSLLEAALRPARRSALARRISRSRLGARLTWRLTCWRARLAGYETARLARLEARRTLYPAHPAPGLFSFLTTVWNTDPAYLTVLADSLFAQAGDPPFEWIILDNGSSDPGTRGFLARLATHPSVRLERVERNIGIIRGLRSCLERATGRYVLPLDSDDYLDPDCLRILAWHIEQHGHPALLYTDEDKLYEGVHCYPYAKPDWDPVLFVNSCYIAHLCALDRAQALALGAYEDRAFEGCHDWDSFMRFWAAGHRPVHVPEIVYGWRMHAGSTSGNIRSKNYIYDSQRALLERFVGRAPHPARYEIVLSPLFPGTPNWWIRRRPTDPRPMIGVWLGAGAGASTGYPYQRWHGLPIDAPLAALAEIARAAQAEGALIQLQGAGIVPTGMDDPAEGPWEAVGLFELFPETALVGGRVFGTDRRLRSAGAAFGHGRGCDCPDAGRRLDDPGYQAQLWQPHSVDAVSTELAVVEPDFLVAAIAACVGDGAGLAHLGAWLGAHARRTGRRVVYTPFLAGQSTTDWEALVGDPERARFVARNRDLMPGRDAFPPALARPPAG